MVLSSNLPHVRCLRGLVKTVPISACCSLTCAMPKRGHASQGFGDRIGGLPHIRDSPLPPRPANYVPPSERNPEDESLAFLPGAKPSSQKPHKTVLGEGQCYAPELSETPLKPVQYMDEDAARVKSTSPYSGRSLVGGSVSDGGDYYHSVATESENLHIVSNGTNEPRSKRLGTFHDHRLDPHLLRSDTLFSSKHEFTRLEEVSEERMHVGGAKGPIPRVRQMEIDAQALEKSYGSPEYPELLRTFRKNYGAKAAVSGDEPSGKVKYSSEDEARGLTGEPLDYLRGSSRLQSQLTTGPHAYNPLTVLQRSGAVRYEGYAFPPTVELGKLKSMEDVGKLREAHRGGVIGEVRRSFNALVGRPDPDNYVATADKPMEDTHLVYRTLGLDAVQRRQMRFMLTDFDYADRNTAFHVMMSYPYTDWIHAFYMVLVGWCLYQLQVRYEAFSFYDEYLGLDLRQAPSVKKPFLVGVTVVVMLFVLFQPLLVASIATNRAYRIAMRRPIGPP